MLSESLIRALKPYSIGDKLRALRLKKSMGLVELGKHTELSAALLSKLERGKLYPTLPTLLKIAMVYGVGLEYFFTDERQRHVVAVVRKKDRKRFPERPGVSDISYFFESLDYPATDKKLSAFQADFQQVAKEKLKPHSHGGVEFLCVLNGTLNMKIGTDEYRLESGDTIYFDSIQQHTYQREGAQPCAALVVTVP